MVLMLDANVIQLLNPLLLNLVLHSYYIKMQVLLYHILMMALYNKEHIFHL